MHHSYLLSLGSTLRSLLGYAICRVERILPVVDLGYAGVGVYGGVEIGPVLILTDGLLLLAQIFDHIIHYIRRVLVDNPDHKPAQDRIDVLIYVLQVLVNLFRTRHLLLGGSWQRSRGRRIDLRKRGLEWEVCMRGREQSVVFALHQLNYTSPYFIKKGICDHPLNQG